MSTAVADNDHSILLNEIYGQEHNNRENEEDEDEDIELGKLLPLSQLQSSFSSKRCLADVLVKAGARNVALRTWNTFPSRFCLLVAV